MSLQLKEQMTSSKDLFLKALLTKDVKILPRLIDKDKTIMQCHAMYAWHINSRVVFCLRMDETNPEQKVNIDRERLVSTISIGV